MPDAQFDFMRDVLAAPSPVGLESAMTEGVLLPGLQDVLESNPAWGVHRFVGNAGVVVDTAPDDEEGLPRVMFVGHADKIRMQVRNIDKSGKIYIDSDSFLPLTLIGNRVRSFPTLWRDRGHDGGWHCQKHYIHFASAAHRTGTKGVKPSDLYVELGLHGEKRAEQIENAGIRVGDNILLDRHISRAFGPDSFSGAYLDNGLGCFAVAELAKLVAKGGPLENVRCLFAFASHEEIGRFGSRVLAGELRPDVLVAVDVDHDYEAAPNVGSERYPPLAMGKGYTLTYGSICSAALNRLFEDVSLANDIPMQRDVRDTGTDGMAGVL